MARLGRAQPFKPIILKGSLQPIVLTLATATALTLATFAPSVLAPRVVTPPTASLVMSLFAPTVQAGVAVTPSTASLTTSLFAPTVVAPQAVTPATASLITAAFAPTVLTPRVVEPATALTLTTYVPQVLAVNLIDVTPTPATLVFTMYDPTVSVSTWQGPKTNYNTRGRIMRHQGLDAMGTDSPFRAVRGRY